MKIRGFVQAATAVAAVILAAGPAQAMDNRAFNINFYSDATMSNQVGFAKAACNPDPYAYLQWGVSTDYQEIVYVGECVNGVLVWY